MDLLNLAIAETAADQYCAQYGRWSSERRAQCGYPVCRHGTAALRPTVRRQEDRIF